MPRVVVVINSMEVFEVVYEWNIVVGLCRLRLSFGVDEIFCRNLLTWMLFQYRLVRHHFHYTIWLL